ncbi:hypothetical protein MHK_003444 [Candidatus Magnetomorum sp. HK-1]|nr:hypothetical protein MHK_003444 [Candidatus Magnetomorum sp. HK-1]
MGEIVFASDSFVQFKSADDAWKELKSGFQSPGIERFSMFQQDENIRLVVNKMGGWAQVRMWKAAALESGSKQERVFKEIYGSIELKPGQISWKDGHFNKPNPKSSLITNPERQKRVTSVDIKQFEKIRKARGVWLSMPLTEKQLYVSKVNSVGKNMETKAYKLFLNEYMMKSEPPQMIQQPQIYQGMRRM